MSNRKAKRWSGTIWVVVFMALMLMMTVCISLSSADRATRILGWVIEKLNEDPKPRTLEETRERWRVTRPGMLLSDAFIPKCEAPGLRAMKKKGENGQPGSQPFQQASESHSNP